MGVLGPQETKLDGWTYLWPEGDPNAGDGLFADFRFRRVGDEYLVEWNEPGLGWKKFGRGGGGPYKDEDDVFAEIELSRAEPDPS